MTGTFYVGYEINKQVKMKIQLPLGTTFGGINCCFLKRSMFIYKCKQPMTCYAMRRYRWMQLVVEFPEMTRSIKKHIVEQYDRDIR